MFSIEILHIYGRTPGQVCCDIGHPTGVFNVVLQFHFRQAVLANVRGEWESRL